MPLTFLITPSHLPGVPSSPPLTRPAAGLPTPAAAGLAGVDEGVLVVDVVVAAVVEAAVTAAGAGAAACGTSAAGSIADSGMP